MPKRHDPASAALDAQVGNLIIEVKSGVRGALAIRDGFWRLATELARVPELRALLVLDRPGVGPDRIAEEERQAAAVLRPGVGGRIRVVVVRDPGLHDFPQDLGPAVRDAVARAISGSERVRRTAPDRGHASLAVLHVLLDRWVRAGGPMHANELMAAVGCSYPTVAAALDEVREDLVRHRDRRVELARWPRQAWSRYLSVQERVRRTERYVDRSGTPRAASDLARRLVRLGRSDIAIGGVLGAAHHVEALDVVGTPTLALTIHDPEGTATSEFVQRLDPALARVESAQHAPTLVVHRQRLRRFLAMSKEKGAPWADPVECLLDLHEAGLEGLAGQFLEAARQRREKTQ